MPRRHYLDLMPVIVVGADTEVGQAILNRFYDAQREVRAFVSDEDMGLALKQRGFKVAIGDVSDDSHVQGAATRCFSAVLVAEAASDQRERSFASTPEKVLAGWANAVSASEVKRVIWVTEDPPPETKVGEVATVRPDDPDLVEAVYRLDEAQSIK